MPLPAIRRNALAIRPGLWRAEEGGGGTMDSSQLPETVTTTGPQGLNRERAARRRRARQLRWLRHYARTGSKTEALKIAGIPYRTVAGWKYQDARFRTELDQLEAGLSVVLEERARERAMLSYAEDRSSSDLLKFLLRSYRPDRFGDRIRHDISGEVHVKRIEVAGLDELTSVPARDYDVVADPVSDKAHNVALAPEGRQEAQDDGTDAQDVRSGAPEAPCEARADDAH
jgi:hypothetical protein